MPVVYSNAEASSSRPRKRLPSHYEDDDDDERVGKPVLNDDGEVVIDGWTLDTFENQSIVNTNENQGIFRTLAGNLDTIKQRISEGMNHAKEAAKAIEDASPDDPMITDMEKEFTRSIEQVKILEIKIQVLKDLEMQLRANQPLMDPLQMFLERSERLADEYMALTPRNKFKTNDDYISFRQEVWEVNHEDEGCPPMSNWLPREEGDDDDDDDVEMGGTTQTYRCPLTLRPYEDAVTSILCNHSYSRAAVIDVIDHASKKSRGGKKKARCPMAGCSTFISRDDLRSDPELQRRTDEFERRRRQREEEDED